MNENEPEVVNKPVVKKSAPARPKIIRVIGGLAIKPPPDADFQQVPFTLQGLSEIEGLENADTIIYWPDPDLFDPKVLAKELIEHLKEFDIKSTAERLFGLPIKGEFRSYGDTIEKSDYWLVDISQQFDDVTIISKEPVGENSSMAGIPHTDKPKFIEIRNRVVHPTKSLPAFNGLADLLTKHLRYVRDHQKTALAGKWKHYTPNTGMESPLEFLKLVLCHVTGPSFAAAHRGAAVAVVVPPGMLPKTAKTWITKPLFKSAYSWLSPLIFFRFPGKDAASTKASPSAPKAKKFTGAIGDWCKIDGTPGAYFAVARGMSDESVDAFTEGVLRPNEFAPIPLMHYPYVQQPAPKDPNSQRQGNPSDQIEELIHLCPARTDQDGNAMSLAFMYGSGGLVLMTEPRSLETLLGIKTDDNPFKMIELTNERIQVGKRSRKGYIVAVTLHDDHTVKVKMSIESFRRLLAFYVAAKLAEKNGGTGSINVMVMTVGDSNLSDILGRAKQSGRYTPGGRINKSLNGPLPETTRHDIIVTTPGEPDHMHRLSPELWKVVSVSTLKRTVQRSSIEDDRALRRILDLMP